MPWKLWARIGGTQNSLNNMWKVTILKFLTKANPYCSFSFKRKWKKLTSQRYSPILFKCNGTCLFTDCPVAFHLQVLKFDDKPLFLTVAVNFSSTSIKHKKGETQSRRIQAEERQMFKNVLIHQSPSTAYNLFFSKLEEEELQSGKRDKVGKSKAVFQKISSEANTDQRCHKELIQSLIILKDKLLYENSTGKIKGFIQRIHAHPFSVTCYTEMGVRIYHNSAKTQPLFLDATGTIMSLKGTPYESSVLYYYSLVIKHPMQNNSPVAIAELISTEHSVLALSHFFIDRKP